MRLANWLVPGTGNHLQRLFQPRVQTLEDEYRKLIIDNSIKSPTTQGPFTPVNGSNFPLQFNQEAVSPVTSAYPEPHSRNLPQPIFMHSQNSLHSQMPPQSPLNHPSQSPLNQTSSQQQGPSQWPPAPLAFLPQPNSVNQPSSQGHRSPSSPLYAISFAHTQSPISASTPVHSQSQSVPTSLASLLNEPGASMYVSYPTPPHTQAALHGGDPTMNFSPTHYFDGHGSVGWPLITMPPGQQP